MLLLLLRPPLPTPGRRGRAPGAERRRPCCTTEAEAAAGGASLRCAEGGAGIRTRRSRSGESSAGSPGSESVLGGRRVGARGRSGGGGRAGPLVAGDPQPLPTAQSRASAAYWPRRVSGPAAPGIAPGRTGARSSTCASGPPAIHLTLGPQTPTKLGVSLSERAAAGTDTALRDARDSRLSSSARSG